MTMKRLNCSSRISLLAVTFGMGLSALAADLETSLPKPTTTPIDFEKQIKPLLERSCAQCHSGGKPKGRFRVDSREELLKGGESKETAIIPGKSASSPLVHL